MGKGKSHGLGIFLKLRCFCPQECAVISDVGAFSDGDRICSRDGSETTETVGLPK